MKVYGEAQGGERNMRLNFGGDPDHHAVCDITTNYQRTLMKFSG